MITQYNDGPLGLFLLGVTGDQILERKTYNKIKTQTLKKVRGTVQADILKEDQAQNTCIFSTEFALKMMGDVQEYFISNKVRNFYSVSISGYHIREAGATAVQEIAFTIANAIEYIETCLAQGLKIDDFAPRLSFFFCCTIEFFEEIAKFRVARKVYAKILNERFHAKNQKSLQL